MSTTTAAPVAPTLLNAEEFATRYAGAYVELVDGVVKELPMPFAKHGFICSRIDRLIGNHVETHDLGRVAANDSFVKITGDKVRGADVCYWSYDRLPKGTVPEGLIPLAPDLVIEIRSPTDRWTDMIAKVLEYLEAGVRVVVILDPKTATASVYRPDELQQIIHNSDPLTIPDVLPGFSVPVNRLFE